MEITLAKKDETYGSIVIDLQSSDVSPKYEAKVKDYTKQVQLKGFRPGKVPAGIVKKMYGESIKLEVVSTMVHKSLNEYIQKEGLPILGEPLPSIEDKEKQIDWSKDTSFKFTFDVGITPEFKYDISSKLKMTKYKVDADQDEVDETLENIRKQHGKHEQVEESSDKDVLSGTLSQEKTDFSKENAVITLDKVNAKVISKFIGLKTGDTVELDLKKTFNKDYNQISILTGIPEADAKKLKGDFEFTVTAINRVTPAELNQEFYDKLFGKDEVKNEEELNTKLTEIMAKNFDDLADNYLLKELKDKLIEKTKLDLPEEFLKRWLLETNKETLTSEDLDADFDNYRKSFKWNIITNKIFSDAKLEVQPSEINERAKQFIQQSYFGGMPIGPEFASMFDDFVAKFLKEDNGKNYMNIYHQALEDKVLNFAKSEISIKNKEIKAKDFKALLNKEA